MPSTYANGHISATGVMQCSLSDPLHVWFYGGVFGDGGSNGVIFDWNKFKMAAAAILDNFEWPYLRNGYLYSAHRAVIFAIAQLSCCNHCFFQ